MRLLEVARDQWTILAVCEPDDRCPLLEFLNSDQAGNSLEGVFAIFERVVAAPNGPRFYNTQVSKHLRDQISEFRKGRVRVLWFTDKNKVIICSHAFLKRSRTTPESEIDKAVRCRDNYLIEKELGNIKVFRS